MPRPTSYDEVTDGYWWFKAPYSPDIVKVGTWPKEYGGGKKMVWFIDTENGVEITELHLDKFLAPVEPYKGDDNG